LLNSIGKTLNQSRLICFGLQPGYGTYLIAAGTTDLPTGKIILDTQLLVTVTTAKFYHQGRSFTMIEGIKR
jgi:hypothetical protein